MNALRDWLNSAFGTEAGRAVQMILALLLVIGLLLAIAWLFRRLVGGGFSGHKGARLGVIEAAHVDGRRRLMLLRRDDVEHLVMIGGPNDLLVESRILKAPPVHVAQATRAATPAPMPPRGADDTTPSAEENPSRGAKALAGSAAAIGAAIAGAGAFVRSRTGRGDPRETAIREPEAAPRTLDQAFDAPLGAHHRPPEPQPPIEPPPVIDAASPFEPPRPPVPPRPSSSASFGRSMPRGPMEPAHPSERFTPPMPGERVTSARVADLPVPPAPPVVEPVAKETLAVIEAALVDAPSVTTTKAAPPKSRITDTVVPAAVAATAAVVAAPVEAAPKAEAEVDRIGLELERALGDIGIDLPEPPKPAAPVEAAPPVAPSEAPKAPIAFEPPRSTPEVEPTPGPGRPIDGIDLMADLDQVMTEHLRGEIAPTPAPSPAPSPAPVLEPVEPAKSVAIEPPTPVPTPEPPPVEPTPIIEPPPPPPVKAKAADRFDPTFEDAFGELLGGLISPKTEPVIPKPPAPAVNPPEAAEIEPPATETPAPEPAPAPAPAPVEPPPPKSPVDELEEEMNRLLSELSQAPRR